MKIHALALIYMVAVLSSHVTSFLVFQSKNGPLTSLLLFQSKKLVVGGRNSLYQFPPGNISNSNLEFELDTRCMKQTCDHSPNLTNDVSILSEYTDRNYMDYILVCGTENRQRCYVIKDMNITECVEVPKGTSGYQTLNTTNCLEVPGVTLGSRTSAYAVTTVTTTSNVYIFSAVDDPARQNPTVSLKRISSSNFRIYVQSHTTITAKEGEHLEFVYGFEEYGYTKDELYVYILRNNRTDATTQAYIGQVCSGDKQLQSYIETRFSCGDYDILESAYNYSSDLKGPLLLAAFSSSRHQGSALCALNVTELDGWFRGEKEKCFYSTLGSWPGWIKPPADTDGHSCTTKLKPDTRHQLYCYRQNNTRIRTSSDLRRQHILMDVKRVVTSVAMTSQDNGFTVYLGDRTGHVTKMLFDASFNQSLKLYSVDTRSGEPIRKGMLLDEARNHLYFTYGDKVAMVTTNNCSLHTTCLGCLSDRAASCLWVLAGPSDSRGTCEHMDSGSETGSGNGSELVDHCLPVIHEVWPLTGPVSGGTNLTIFGQFDGLPTDPGELNVTLGQQAVCRVTLVRNDRIHCTTSLVSVETSEVAVTVSWLNRGHTNKLSVPINGTFSYQHSFNYKTPTVNPSGEIFVRQSGGVQIQMFGSNLDIGSTRKVEINDSTEWFDECVITKYDRVTSNTITCKTPAIANCSESHGARIIIDGSVMRGPDIICLDDPVLQSVRPNKSIKSGGVMLTFNGTDFRGLGKSLMYMSLLDKESNPVNTSPGECLLVGEQLECTSGAVNLPNNNLQMPVECSVLVQNVYRDATTFLANGSIDVVNDPEFSPKIKTLYMSSDKEELILKGQYFLNVEESEILIDVGPENCTLVSIDDDALKCSYDVTDDMKDGRTLQVNATIGFRKYTIGYATYMHRASTPKMKAVTVQASSGFLYFGIGIAVIVGLMALAISCFVIRKRKKRGVNLGEGYSATYRNGEFVALSGLSESHAAENEQNQQNVYHQQTFAKSLSENDNACAAETEPLLIDENTRLLLENQNLLIERNCLVMAEVIGQGNFGCVYKCFYNAPGEKVEKIVAAKTLHSMVHLLILRESASYVLFLEETTSICTANTFQDETTTLGQEPRDLDVQMFLKEALLMKDFHHRHVMELIGICLGLDRLPLVVLPYMRAGDLLSYLRDAKNSPTVSNLVSFGIDIANGMHYLSELKFVHRDLAARNCMLNDDLTVKIADFGLSRDVYEKEYYSSSDKNAKLPIKWMSPESLEFRTFSSKSDVWAYGVVLWELLTRGMIPYPTVDNWEILRYLQEGRRMAKPDHCPGKVIIMLYITYPTVDNWEILRYLQEGRRMAKPDHCPGKVYRVMRRCWEWGPDDRPTFGQLTIDMPEILQNPK